MNDVKISASSLLAVDLDHAEMDTVSAFGLLEDVIEPMFHCSTCKGILEDYAKQAAGDLNKAAREWMEENFDALGAALYATRQLVSLVTDTLQLLPRVEERMKEEN